MYTIDERLKALDIVLPDIADVHFDDESPVQRAGRRSLHWTPVVR